MEARTLQPPADTLLIVDDDPLITDLFKQYMTRRGFRILVAQSGQEALALVAQEADAIRLVMTDMTMPGMDGLELASALHTMLPALPVLFATGHDPSLVRSPLPPNVIGVVQKPYQNRLLADQIRQYLEHPDLPFPKAP